ncbi:hypothetical protein EJB05_56804, partial [Eragrostis curvula]
MTDSVSAPVGHPVTDRKRRRLGFRAGAPIASLGLFVIGPPLTLRHPPTKRRTQQHQHPPAAEVPVPRGLSISQSIIKGRYSSKP